jgi:hypothetical protein
MISKANYEKLMWWVAKFHSIFSTAWPKPGEPALAGASTFIGTNLFKTLENGLACIEEAIDESDENDSGKEIKHFWTAFKALFVAVSMRDRNEKSQQIDFALNLLYFASGVFYHRLEELSFVHPDLDKDFIRIKSFSELVKLCRWPTKTENVKAVYSSLIGEMMACAQDLN